MKHAQLKKAFCVDLVDFTPSEIELIWKSVYPSICSHIDGCLYELGEKHRNDIKELEWEYEDLEEAINTLHLKIKQNKTA